jgi:hypothetical protein
VTFFLDDESTLHFLALGLARNLHNKRRRQPITQQNRRQWKPLAATSSRSHLQEHVIINIHVLLASHDPFCRLMSVLKALYYASTDLSL